MNLFLVFALILLQPTEGVLKSNKGEIELLSHRSSLFLDRIMVPMSHLRWYANALKTLLRRFEESTRERICTKKNGSNCCIGDVAKNIVKGTRFVNHLPRKKHNFHKKYTKQIFRNQKKRKDLIWWINIEQGRFSCDHFQTEPFLSDNFSHLIYNGSLLKNLDIITPLVVKNE